MASCNSGRIHSVQSLGTVDGPGLRSVVFFQGCPLRCACCHNPDTWEVRGGEETTAEAMAKKLLRYETYWKNGGVTLSGGEPLLQAAFAAELCRKLKEHKVHIALDTSGCVMNADGMELLDVTDLVLLDWKMPTPELYRSYTGGDMARTEAFLRELQSRNKPVWLRQVIIPGITDSEESLRALWEVKEKYPCVQKAELLPFRKLCTEKYDSMGISFPLRDTPEADGALMQRLNALWNLWEETISRRS